MTSLRRLFLTTLTTGAVLAACADGGGTSDTSASAPTTTSTPATTTTTAASDGLSAVTVELPDGDFVAAPGDLVVLRSNQDLEYWPNALSPGNEAPHILLAAAGRHDGFTSVSDVAGIVNGSVLFATPARTNVYAVDAPSSVTGPIAGAEHVQLSPDGTRLGLARPSQLAIVDAATGAGASRLRDPSEAGDRPVVDLAWLDDDTMVALTVDVGAGTYWLEPLDAETLLTTREAVELDTPSRFAGRTADGLLGLVRSAGDSLRVVYLDAALEEQPNREQSFPLAGFGFIEIDPRGLGQVWVDGGRLYHLGPGQFEARELDREVLRAWFVA